MNEWINKDMGFIPLKKFKTLDISYIRIYPTKNVLKGVTRRQNKTVDGIELSIQKTFWLDIPIGLNTFLKQNKDIIVFHLHDINAENLFTLLNLMPDRLELNYYPDNYSNNTEKWGIRQEALYIKGCKENKKGRIVKTYSVNINGYIHKDNKKDLAGYDINNLNEIPKKGVI